MKNIKWLGTLSLTAAGTAVAVLCASRWAPAQTAPATRIVVAAVDIDVGQRLAPRFVKLTDWPAGKIPPGAFSDPRKLDGRVLRASILHGEPLTESGLQPPGRSAVGLYLGELVALAVRRGETKQSDLARCVGLSSIRRNNQPVFRDHDPDTAAWLSLLGEPQAPVTPTGAGKPARM